MKSRKTIIKKTILIGISTFASRIFGLIRDILMIRFLGVGVVSDAFNTAFMLPNTLRKIFAEGALTAAMTPTVVSVLRKHDTAYASRLITLIFIAIQSLLFLFCILMSVHSMTVVSLIAPGFNSVVLSQAALLTSVLIFFIIAIAGCAVIASALNALHRFFVPANSQIVLNILFVLELLICLYFQLSVKTLAVLIVGNGALLLLIHLWAYKHAGFAFAKPDRHTWQEFFFVMKKFVPSLITVGSVELSLVIDRIMASYLPVGSISLLQYTSQFMRLPLSIFAIAFATILFPHVSSVAQYAPRRLWFYLFDSFKLVVWVTVPCSLLMAFFSYDVFYTLFLSEKFTLVDVAIAGQLLATFALGLFFFSFNKILANIFYAHHDTMRPTLIALAGALINTLLNFIFMKLWGITGIVLATCISGAIQTVFFLMVLHYFYKITLPLEKCGRFVLHTGSQCLIFGLMLYGGYKAGLHIITWFPDFWATFFSRKLGFWLWIGPLCATLGILMFFTRKKFGIRIYFLDQQG